MEFEKYLKENLSKQRSEIDATKMWDNVSNKIDFKKKKRRGFIYWFSGIAIFSGLCLSLFIFTDISNSRITSKSDNKNQSPVTNSDNALNISANTSTSHKSNSTGNNISKNKIDKSISNTLDNKIVSSTSHSQNKKDISKQTSQNLSNTKSFLTDTKTEIINTSKKSSLPTADNNSYYPPITPNSKSYPLTNKEQPLSENKNNYSNYTTAQISQPTNTKSTVDRQEQIIFLSLLETTELTYNRDITSYDLNPFIMHPRLKSESNARLFSVSLYSGIGLSKKKLASQDSMYTALRNSTERTLEHLNITADLQYKLNNNWSIGSGLDYLSLTEKFIWEGSYEETTTGTYVDTIFYSTKTDSTLSFKSGEYSSLIRRNMVKYNRYHFINIPISLQYRLRINDHHFKIQPAVLFNIAYKAKGDYLNNFGVPAQLEDLKTSASMQYQMSLNYARDIGRSWKWNIGTSLRWAPVTSLGQNAARTESSYLFYNLRMGLTKQF